MKIVLEVVDWAAVGVAIGAVLGWLPPLAALFTVVWLGLNIMKFVNNREWKRRG